MPPPPAVALLAVACINVNGYDPVADILIAQFEDVDERVPPDWAISQAAQGFPPNPNDVRR